MMKSQESYQKGMIQGNQHPTNRVVADFTASDIKDAERLLYAGGTKLDPWQYDGLADWLALTPYGKWAHPTCGASVPRQNGKSGLVQGRAESGMLMYAEQVIYTAHLQKTATETFEEMRVFYESPALEKHVKEIKTAIGREQIILRNGARIKFLARTRNGGRGQHGDLLIFDEAQELDTDQQASFLPAISASLNPQTIYVGTPPDPNTTGDVFRGIRQKAVEKKTKSMAWFEFSVDEIGDVNDMDRWALTNPALGIRILPATVESECDQMAPDTFARERLGYWAPELSHELDYAIPADIWEECKSTKGKPEGKTAYGIKFSADGAEVALCGAVIPDMGPARISLIDRRPTGHGLQWLADWLNQRYNKAACVVIDGRNGVDVLVDKISPVWKMKESVIRPGVKIMIAAVSTLTDAINEKTVTWYEGQEDLKDSAITSTKRKFSGGWGFGGENPIPIEAAALALWGAKTSKRNPNKTMRIG